MKLNSFNSGVAFLLLIWLSGCGGGGGSAPAVQSAAQGVYQGTTSNGLTVDAIVLEDGSFWEIYGTPSGSALVARGILTGSLTANNGTFSASFTEFDNPGNSPISGQASGTYSPAAYINGTSTGNGTNVTFNFTAPVQTTYNYNTAASISSILGTWSGGLLDGETDTVNVQANGTFSSTSSGGCISSGTVTPRPSGKNVFDVSFTSGASPCAAPNQTMSGIGLIYPLSNGTNQLIVELVNPSNTLASAFFAARSTQFPLARARRQTR